MSCSGSLKKGRFGYQWQAALALVGPIYDTSVESTIFAGITCAMEAAGCYREVHSLMTLTVSRSSIGHVMAAISCCLSLRKRRSPSRNCGSWFAVIRWSHALISFMRAN